MKPFACVVCGAGHLLDPNATDFKCHCCGAKAEFRSCPKCHTPVRAGPPWTLPGVKDWRCDTCGKTTSRRRWALAVISACPPLPYEFSLYGDQLISALSNPYRRRINGSVLAFNGGSGLSNGGCVVLFDEHSIILMVGDMSRPMGLPYSEIAYLQIGGRGDYLTRTGGGWVGGGFGTTVGATAKGMLEGAALASVMNALTTRTQHHTETIVVLTWRTGSLAILNTELPPATWNAILQPVFARIASAHAQIAYNNSERPCPFCAETIKAAAIRCRFCGADLRVQ